MSATPFFITILIYSVILFRYYCMTYWQNSPSSTIFVASFRRFWQMQCVKQIKFLCWPPHDKTNKITVLPAKTQISLCIRPVWSEFHCPHKETFDPKLPIKRIAKNLISLGGFPGWSESSFGAQVILLVLSCCGVCSFMPNVILSLILHDVLLINHSLSDGRYLLSDTFL